MLYISTSVYLTNDLEHVSHVVLHFVPNSSEIEQSAAELCRFQGWKFGGRRPLRFNRKLIFAILHPSVIQSTPASACEISTKFDNPWLSYWWLNKFSRPIFRGQFRQGYFSGMPGPNCTKFGENIHPSKSLNRFVLDSDVLLPFETRPT